VVKTFRLTKSDLKIELDGGVVVGKRQNSREMPCVLAWAERGTGRHPMQARAARTKPPP